jgi:Zn-dependent protease
MRRPKIRLPKSWSRWRPRLYGAEVRVHVTAWFFIAIIALSTLKSPLLGLAAISAYLGMVLLHECGHAYIANRLGYRVYGIEVGAFHGLCRYESHGRERDEAIIAWGGVAAQLALAIPIIALDQILALRSGAPFVSGMVMILGYYSALLALINLIPVAPLDGARAWRLPRILREEYRRKHPRKSAASTSDRKTSGNQRGKDKVVKGPWKGF